MEHDNEGQIMTNRELLRDTHSKVNEMYNSFYGDPRADIPGIGQRVSKLEKAEHGRMKLYVMISSMSAGGTLIFKTLWEHLQK